MRLLLNENVPIETLESLRSVGVDVRSVRLDAPGMSDRDVLAWARREERVLVTFDKDFGELAYSAGLPASCGIILLRIPPPRESRGCVALAALIAARGDWPGHFAVIEPGRVRMRALRAV